MSRATFTRHFRGRLGRFALDLLTDLRMSLAANELKKPALSTEAVAEKVGYQSVSAFRRVFAERMRMTAGMTGAECRTTRRDPRSTDAGLIISSTLLSLFSLEICMGDGKVASIVTFDSGATQ
jgi:AraC-like DNA-binding protein